MDLCRLEVPAIIAAAAGTVAGIKKLQHIFALELGFFGISTSTGTDQSKLTWTQLPIISIHFVAQTRALIDIAVAYQSNLALGSDHVFD